jgi:hypothetical protein
MEMPLITNFSHRPNRHGISHLRGKGLTFSRWVKAAVIVTGLTYLASDTRGAYIRQAAARETPPRAPEGSYLITSILKDRQEVLPANLDEFRWKRISLRQGALGVLGLDGASHRFKAEGDPLRGAMTLLQLDEKGAVVKGAPPVGT